MTRGPLRGREPVEHHEKRERERVGQLGCVRRIDGTGRELVGWGQEGLG